MIKDKSLSEKLYKYAVSASTLLFMVLSMSLIPWQRFEIFYEFVGLFV